MLPVKGLSDFKQRSRTAINNRMNPKHPFIKRRSNISQNSPVISFRFNKHDEEVEEVSFEKKDSSQAFVINASTSNPVAESSQSTINTVESEEADRLTLADIAKSSETTIPKDALSDQAEASSKKSFESHSKLSHQARSLDSECNPPDAENWTFLKDLKGKIAKNIEECIPKDVVKGLVTCGELGEPLVVSGNSAENSDLTSALASTGDEDDHVSPSIEATENLKEEDLLPHYVTKEIEFIKPVRSDRNITAPSKSQITIQTKKKPTAKPDFNMKLSTLIASRSFSSEDDKSEGMQPPVREESLQESTVITSDIETPENPQISSKSLKSEFSKVFLKLKKFYSFLTSWNSGLTYFLVVLIAYSILPIPSAVRWFSIGAVSSGVLMYWIMKPAAKVKQLKIPDYKNLPPLAIPTSDISRESAVYMGWMNELPSEYNPDTYHVNCTHSVYLRLDGSSLRVSYPVNNIPKRAMFNERRHELASLYPRHHDITGATVELLPEGLPKKRLWSKKYPICLKVLDQRPYATKESCSTDVRSSKLQSSKELSPSKRYEPKVNDNGEIVLYLFSRTDREKDDWYRRFQKASRIKMMRSHSPLSSPNISRLNNSLSENKRAISVDLGSLHSSSGLGNSLDEPMEEGDDDAFAEIKFDKFMHFDYYMSLLLPNASTVKRLSPTREKGSTTETKDGKNQDLVWLNALIGRLFFDFLTEDIWADVIAEKIQRKLSKIKLPHFIQELKITDKHLGSSLPNIHRTSSPVMDQRGLWMDIDISYNGCFQMTLETKLNLLKLERGVDYPFSSMCVEKELKDLSAKSHVYDSEEEDSADTSSDDDIPMPEMSLGSEDSSASTSSGGSAGKKLIRLVDKIAQSSYFQTAAKNRFFKKAMVEVSNTPLVLTVEVQCLTGTLAINIPPLPTDRLWYGFRKNPELCIQARPKLGCRVVTMTHVIDWIEKKLVLEFQKVLVMPNMDDLVIPIMQPDI